MSECTEDTHHFEPRYDRGPSEIPSEWRFHAVISEDAFRLTTYVGDICTRCGKWAKRPESKPEASG